MKKGERLNPCFGRTSWATAVLALLLVFIMSLNSQAADRQLQANAKKEKPEVTDDKIGTLTDIPYAKEVSNDMPLVSDKKIPEAELKTSVSGLKDAGYELDEIVVILKNDDKSASQISYACLSCGYNGKEIYNALSSSGFKSREVDSAVPPALRTENQFFKVDSSNPDSVAAELSLISPNPFSGLEIKSNTEKTASLKNEETDKKQPELNPVKVEVNVGITFDGLADWQKFQDQRFNNKN